MDRSISLLLGIEQERGGYINLYKTCSVLNKLCQVVIKHMQLMHTVIVDVFGKLPAERERMGGILSRQFDNLIRKMNSNIHNNNSQYMY